MKPEGEEVRTLGGLHIVGTERHEARRIDLQLRGRCGRQGDPGSSRFFLSLEDDLMRIFAGEWVKNVLTRLGMQEGEAIESRLVTRRVEGPQKKVEEHNFEIRKNLLEYDEVMDEQRAHLRLSPAIPGWRNCKQLILEMIDEQVDRHLEEFLAKDYGTDSLRKRSAAVCRSNWTPAISATLISKPRRDLPRTMPHGWPRARLLEAIEENLPEEEDSSRMELGSAGQTAQHALEALNVRDRDLKKIECGGWAR